MSEVKLTLPTRDQMIWPTLIVSLVMGGGSGVGLIDRWNQYVTEQEEAKEEIFAAKGALSARIGENSRQNRTEWRVFSGSINDLEERVSYLEGKLGVIHVDHDPLPHEHPEIN